MEILVVGGFLGSGKTTLVSKAVKGMCAAGMTAAIIENEIGADGVDSEVLESTGVTVTPLFGGCVCCQISGNLLSAAMEIEKTVYPDWLVVEMTGLALIDGIRKLFASYGKPQWRIHTVSLVDIVRFDRLLAAMRPVITRQIDGADVILVNKSDAAEFTGTQLETLRGLCAPKAVIESVSLMSMNEADVWQLLYSAINDEGRDHVN